MVTNMRMRTCSRAVSPDFVYSVIIPPSLPIPTSFFFLAAWSLNGHVDHLRTTFANLSLAGAFPLLQDARESRVNIQHVAEDEDGGVDAVLREQRHNASPEAPKVIADTEHY